MESYLYTEHEASKNLGIELADVHKAVSQGTLLSYGIILHPSAPPLTLLEGWYIDSSRAALQEGLYQEEDNPLTKLGRFATDISTDTIPRIARTLPQFSAQIRSLVRTDQRKHGDSFLDPERTADLFRMDVPDLYELFPGTLFNRLTVNALLKGITIRHLTNDKVTMISSGQACTELYNALRGPSPTSVHVATISGTILAARMISGSTHGEKYSAHRYPLQTIKRIIATAKERNLRPYEAVRSEPNPSYDNVIKARFVRGVYDAALRTKEEKLTADAAAELFDISANTMKSYELYGEKDSIDPHVFLGHVVWNK